MYTNGRHHCIALGVNYAQIIRERVDYVDFVLLAVRCNTGWARSNLEHCRQLKCPQINHRDGVALTISDISVFTVRGIETRKFTEVEVPPAKPCRDRQSNHAEEEFFQVSEMLAASSTTRGAIKIHSTVAKRRKECSPGA